MALSAASYACKSSPRCCSIFPILSWNASFVFTNISSASPWMLSSTSPEIASCASNRLWSIEGRAGTPSEILESEARSSSSSSKDASYEGRCDRCRCVVGAAGSSSGMKGVGVEVEGVGSVMVLFNNCFRLSYFYTHSLTHSLLWSLRSAPAEREERRPLRAEAGPARQLHEQRGAEAALAGGVVVVWPCFVFGACSQLQGDADAEVL